MRKRIKIIYHKPEPTFVERLETRARRAVKNRRHPSPILAGLIDEIELTLGQIESARTLHANLRRGLLRLETYIDTELMHRSPRPPNFYDHRVAERDMLRARLLHMEAERRKLAIFEEFDLRKSHERLWSLLQQHEQMMSLNGNRENRKEAGAA